MLLDDYQKADKQILNQRLNTEAQRRNRHDQPTYSAFQHVAYLNNDPDRDDNDYTHQITDATAWRCLVSSESTEASLSTKSTWNSVGHLSRHQGEVANRQHRRDPQHNDPQALVNSPGTDPTVPEVMLALALAKQRESFSLAYIASVAPTDPGLQEPVDVSVKYSCWVTHLVLVSQILDHLIGVQYVGAHLIAPRTATLTF